MISDSNMMHGRDWSGQDVSGWYVTEKFRGVRAYWDGFSLWTRGGNVIHAPRRFTEGLPQMHLDCELFCGRCDIETEAQVAARTGEIPDHARLMVFDAPMEAGGWLERMAHVFNAPLGAHAERAKFDKVEDMDWLRGYVRRVLKCGGEGVVVRRANLLYKPGRTFGMLKIKSVF